MSAPESDEARIRDLAREAMGCTLREIEPIEPGLGARRFYRVHLLARPHSEGGPASVVARIEAPEDGALRPPGISPEPPLEPIRALLEQQGFPVPRCYAIAPDLMLLEDVGDTSLETVAGTRAPEEIHSLYREACRLVSKLQRVTSISGVPNFHRQLDDALFHYKAEQVVEWVLPLLAPNASKSPARADAVRDAFAFISGVAREAPQRLAHRDFKAANLHLHAHPPTSGRLTCIDLQGAFLAPPEYDLVCLLRDSHVALEESFVRAALDDIRPQLPDAPDAGVFAERFGLLTLTRNGKDLARFLYAARVRGDDRYLRLLPRAVATLKAAAREVANVDPCVDRLAELFLALPDTPCAE